MAMHRANSEPLKFYSPDAVEAVSAFRTALSADICAYCGGPADTVDHIEPVGRGGENHWSNLTGACQDCNRRKGTRSLLGFLLARPLFQARDEINDTLRLLT